MRKSFLITSIVSSVALVAFVAISSSTSGFHSLFKTLANRGAANALTLNSQKISTATSSYTNEISRTVYTGNNNPVEFKSANVIKNDSGWQTILPGGYFYNPLTNSQNHNKITGISSVRFNSAGSSKLSLCYGYTLDNQNIIYSYEKDLSPNTTYSLDDLNPSYLYIKNNNNSNVSINDLIINYSCVETAYPKQDLNILMIGNSFAEDTTRYSSSIAESYNINLNLYAAYKASCSIDTHYSNLINDTVAYSMRGYPGGEYSNVDDLTLTQIINSRTWDIITFQQASAQIGRTGTYSNLSNLVNAVRNLVGSGPKFYWYQTWSYDTDYHDYHDYFSYFGNNSTAMYNAINERYEADVEPLGLFEKFIPAGTAVQNLRTSFMKETFSRDGKHMSNTHGRFLLGLNFVSHIYDIDFSKSPSPYIAYGVRDTFMTVAYEAIKNAQKNPRNLTNSLYPVRALEGYNLSNYTEIDAELVGCSYWNSMDSSNYNKRFANTSGTSNKYVSTKRFTQTDLPIGSIVVIDDAFGVRPEAWKTDAKQSSRPNEVYTNLIEINSSFWSGYQYRAFNIFKVGLQPLSGSYVDEQFDEIFDGFHIYVPNASLGNLKPKTYNPKYDADKNLFMNNLLNIDAFKRVHLDPITGFYKCDELEYLMNKYVDDTAQKFVCTRPFYTANGDLPENTVLVVDSGYQWRSDCWLDHGITNRPNNVTNELTVLTSSFMSGYRNRTFNVSSTSSYYVYQKHREFMDHFRIYVPVSDDIEIVEPAPTPYDTNFPEGTFKGSATVLGNEYTIVLSIGAEGTNLVGVRLSNTDAVAISISFNNSTKLVTINTSGDFSGYSFGTITGTYDKANGQITGVSCSGGISSYVSDNGRITCTKATEVNSQFFDECNVSTSQLRGKYKRRYMSGSWQVDTSNLDRITCNMSEFVGGGASLKRKGYSSGAVALNLNNDFSPAITVANVQFWVYNPSSTDITLRMWGYKATSFGSNFETGSVTAKANRWTYVAMGFTEASIYNFQIADFNNTGVDLSFDNIYLF